MKPKFLFVIFYFFLQNSIAQNGVLDNSFGSNGLKTIAISNKNVRGYFILTFSDNSFMVSGNTDENPNGAINRSAFISKHTSDGNLDLTFGNNGFITIPNGSNGISSISDMVKQPDGKILISGFINGRPMLMRLFENGNYDSSFGSNGIANVSVNGKIGIQNDGKIIIATGFQNGNTCVYSFSKFLENGNIDASFGINGTMLNDITGYDYDYCLGIKILPDNKFITIGTSSFHWGNYRNAVVCKFDENGNPDNTFGTNGMNMTAIGTSPGYAIFRDFEILNNGQIVTCGSAEYSGGTGGFGGTKPVVVKYNSNGTLDTAFGTNGIVILNTIFNANDNFYAIKVQQDGKILGLGGSAYPYPYMQSYLNITRLTETGNLDLSFGNNGVFLTNTNNSQLNGGWEIDIQNDDKIIAVGYTATTDIADKTTLICRLSPDNSLNTDENMAERHIKIYPNPTTEYIHLSNLSEILGYTIYNLLGDKIEEGSISDNEKIDVRDLTNGLYLLKFANGTTLKFTKE
ncbi:T9SS type A sorting domain-containing protein [Flavobacterium wongokense]|uniref:T9SS type A sorting domain-containing protein n=1 Tax=Flavobacterium wongokense TaxID=2910674 RepID=UPI001F442F03|nr:T9SS type A sorting domain-containing protein [Flavobacterium sp. WG47]MCF6133431.1 T9SS type A sorting domain-containing protein [Flavobacterium sp. WG47]